MPIPRRFIFILFMGFFSGLPSALTASTLQARLTVTGLTLASMGYISLLAIPYGLRFLWMPFFDRYPFPFLDRRRGWLWCSQLGLVVTISLMGMLDVQYFYGLLFLGLLTALFSTTQDVLISAWQTEIFNDIERGLSSSLLVIGWRVGAIFSGGIALLFAQYMSWRAVYLWMAAIMSFSLFFTVYADRVKSKYIFSSDIKNYFIAPFKEFFHRYPFKMVVCFILILLTYKLGDALALSFNTTFLLREIQFNLATVGLVNKTVSLFAAVLGGMVAGLSLRRLTLFKGLLIFGFIQSMSNLGYLLLIWKGKNYFLLVITAFLENFCSGMGTIAFLTFVMLLCNTKFTATQFAFFSGLSFFGKILAGPFAAYLISKLGWFEFFIICSMISFPALFFLYYVRMSPIFESVYQS